MNNDAMRVSPSWVVSIEVFTSSWVSGQRYISTMTSAQCRSQGHSSRHYRYRHQFSDQRREAKNSTTADDGRGMRSSETTTVPHPLKTIFLLRSHANPAHGTSTSSLDLWRQRRQ